MATDSIRGLLRLRYHHRRVPADEGTDTAFDFEIAWKPVARSFDVRRNRVQVRRLYQTSQIQTEDPPSGEEMLDQKLRPLVPPSRDHRIERGQPLLRLRRIHIRKLLDETLFISHVSMLPLRVRYCTAVTY